MKSHRSTSVQRNVSVLERPVRSDDHSRVASSSPPPGISVREENGLIVLSPADGAVRRRILHVNSYGGRFVWNQIVNGQLPNHQLLGCVQLARLGYEVALAEPLKHFYLYRNPLPHDLRLLKWVLSWLGKDGILFCGHTLLYWLTALKQLGVVRCPIVSLIYAREELDWAATHTGLLALTPAAFDHAKTIAPRAKTLHLGWGVDLDFFSCIAYQPEWFLSCGIANRDFRTLAAAAAETNANIRVICPGFRSDIQWPAHVDVVDGGAGWLTDTTKTITPLDLRRSYFPHSAGTLIVMNADPTEYTANGFTNLMEAMAMGQPVIVTRTGALPGEIDVERHGCGLYVPPNDPGALARAIDTLAHDSPTAKKMGLAGRRLIETHYNIDRCARDLHQFFDSI